MLTLPESTKQAIFRKATTIFHVLVGLIAALATHWYPSWAIFLFVAFVAWEYSDNKEEACKDCWEALAGAVIGTALLLAIRLFMTLDGSDAVLILA